MRTEIAQKREVFHLAFLRALGRSVPPSALALKGGCNLRFFFGSCRYSEDMDLDVTGIEVFALKERVMSVLQSAPLAATLRTFGIDEIRPPDLARAKQTETVQRFKVHLLTAAGEDLSTKIEFSRRGMDAPVLAEPVSPEVLAAYRLAPLIVPHYAAPAAVRQKLQALASRPQAAARDVFDLYALSSQPGVADMDLAREIGREQLEQALERTYSIDYRRYHDTVVSFLEPADQTAFDRSEMWDQIRLVAVSLIERGLRDGR